jgi:hypothetical protein
MVYERTNTSLTTTQRQSLVKLLLAKARQSTTDGLVYDLKPMVIKSTCPHHARRLLMLIYLGCPVSACLLDPRVSYLALKHHMLV